MFGINYKQRININYKILLEEHGTTKYIYIQKIYANPIRIQNNEAIYDISNEVNNYQLYENITYSANLNGHKHDLYLFTN